MEHEELKKFEKREQTKNTTEDYPLGFSIFFNFPFFFLFVSLFNFMFPFSLSTREKESSLFIYLSILASRSASAHIEGFQPK